MARIALVDTYLFECSPYDPATNANVGVYWSTAEWFSEPSDTPASVGYDSGMTFDGFGVSILDLDQGMLSGFQEMTSGKINIPIALETLTASPGQDSQPSYSWANSKFTIYKIAAGAAHASRAVHMTGYITGVSGDEQSTQLTAVSVDSFLLAKPIQTSKFWGRKYALAYASGATMYTSCGDVCDLTGSFTLEALLQPNSAAPATVGIIFAKFLTDGWLLQQNTDGTFEVYVENDGTAQNWSVTSNAPPTIGHPVMVSSAYDSVAHKAYVYFDGVLVATNASTTTDPRGNAANLIFGGDTTSAQTFDGRILELRIWNEARAQDDIASSLYGGFDGVPSTLIGWWKHSDGTGNTLTDYAETPHNGTINGTGAETYHLYNAQATGSSHGKINFATTSAANLGTGWTVGTTTPTKYSLMNWGSERAAASFGASSQPANSPTTLDCWRSESKISGRFAAGNFSVAVALRAVTAGGAMDGAAMVRIWKSKNADGSDAIELTSGAQTGSTVTNLATGVTQTSTVTCAISETRFVDEYLFIQVAWKITGAGSTANDDALLRANESTVTTTTLRPYWVDTYEGEETLAGVAKPWAVGTCFHREPVLIDAVKLIYALCSRGFGENSLNSFPSGAPMVYDGGVQISNDSTLAPKTFYFYDTTASGSSHGKMDETAPSSANSATGWTQGTTASGKYSLMLVGTERAAATFGSTAMPNTSPTTNDCWRSESALTGRFAAGDWLIYVKARAVNASGAQGRARVRIWKSANANGSSGTELTTATAVGTDSGQMQYNTTHVSSVTAACAAFDFSSEYLFIQIAWESTATGSGASQDVLVRAGESQVSTPGFSSGGTTSESDIGLSAPSAGTMKYDATLGIFRLETKPVFRLSASFCAADYDGESTSLPVGQIRAICEGSAGMDPSELSIAATDFAPVDAPDIISGIYLQSGSTTCVEVLRRVLNNYRATAGGQYDGIIRARSYSKAKLTGAAAVFDYGIDDTDAVRRVAVLKPIKEVLAKYKPYDPPYGPGEIAGAVTSSQSFDLMRAFRSIPRIQSVDRLSNDMASYGDDARRVVFQTDVIADWMMAYTVEDVLEAFDAMISVVEFNLLIGDEDRTPQVGDVVSLTYPRFGFDTLKKCLVTKINESQPGNRIVLQLMDAQTVTS